MWFIIKLTSIRHFLRLYVISTDIWIISATPLCTPSLSMTNTRANSSSTLNVSESQSLDNSNDSTLFRFSPKDYDIGLTLKDAADYPKWVFRLKHHLMPLNLWDIPASLPLESAIVFTIITRNISDSLLDHMIDFTTSTQAWNYIKDLFSGTSISRQRDCLRLLPTLTINHVSRHEDILKMKDFERQLRAAVTNKYLTRVLKRIKKIYYYLES